MPPIAFLHKKQETANPAGLDVVFNKSEAYRAPEPTRYFVSLIIQNAILYLSGCGSISDNSLHSMFPPKSPKWGVFTEIISTGKIIKIKYCKMK